MKALTHIFFLPFLLTTMCTVFGFHTDSRIITLLPPQDEFEDKITLIYETSVL